MSSVIRSYVRLMDRLADFIGEFAKYLIYLMIAVLLFDVISDKAFSTVQNWTVEMAQFTLAAFYFMAGPQTLKDDKHVRLDLIYSHLSDRAKAMIDMVTVWIVIFYLSVMLWGATSSLKYSWATNQKLPSLWAPSLVPIKVLMVVCIVLMILQCFSIFFKDVAKVRGKVLA
ncbi:TRAP transporter small permease subunit [Aerobium aerolatum]|uniref:TRAP transporter small permease protein n=1 Tax=Aquamicrobium aerolatum DSM 21857 TaxID=1121003 RepID=A0A1I3LIC9_9HYPH|nr:TRAP transporter small permease subunit [Aquamicrobium aerolatum]SFI84508.1 TRAP-type mannitol/chloroaromatic compound transport system, small permease component [Aquamicrobium aerolatum DSM 21857]